mmetsp:Transcript_23339/g.55168  ORF Transcript_23339/g.55168 Transcript_23339/m.55168 type:complete len:91 (-) Transcript_23339:518-790(-)
MPQMLSLPAWQHSAQAQVITCGPLPPTLARQLPCDLEAPGRPLVSFAQQEGPPGLRGRGRGRLGRLLADALGFTLVAFLDRHLRDHDAHD